MDSGAVLKRQAAALVGNNCFTNDPFHQQVLFFVWSKHDFIFPFAAQDWLGEFFLGQKMYFLHNPVLKLVKDESTYSST